MMKLIALSLVVFVCSISDAQTANDFLVIQSIGSELFNTTPVIKTEFVSYEQEPTFSTAPQKENITPVQQPLAVAPTPRKEEVQAPVQAPVKQLYSAPTSYVQYTPVAAYQSAPRRWFGGRWFGGGRRSGGGRMFGIFRRGGC